MSDENLGEIERLIDSMQSGLVELFNQLRELRRRLNMTEPTMVSDTQSSVVPLFTEVSKPSTESLDDVTTESTPKTQEISSPSDKESKDELFSSPTSSILESESKDLAPEFLEADIDSKLPDSIPIGSAKVARVLDPIAHELRTGGAPASVLAEYLQSAKDYLFSGDNSNERVERDLDVVLKFLKARDTKGIRPEERDNILKRIDRWKEALVETH